MSGFILRMADRLQVIGRL